MKTLAEMNAVELSRRIAQLEKLIEERAKDLLEEKRIAQKYHQKATQGISQIYAEFQKPWPAIELCLEMNGDYVLTTKQIQDELLKGGYKGQNPPRARYLINDSMNGQEEIGVLEYVGSDKIVGRIAKKKMTPASAKLGKPK